MNKIKRVSSTKKIIKKQPDDSVINMSESVLQPKPVGSENNKDLIYPHNSMNDYYNE